MTKFDKSIWYDISYDYDDNIAIPATREVLASASWSDATFSKLRCGLERRFNEVPIFFEKHDYTWVLSRDSYDFIGEPLHQMIALDVLLGVWSDISEEDKISPLFSRICTRTSNIWGLGNTTPRALHEKIKDMRFIIIPFGWDDLNWFIINGFFHFIGKEEHCALDTLNYSNIDIVDVRKYGPLRAERFWQSILAKAIVGQFKCPDVLAAGFNAALIEDVKALSKGLVHMTSTQFPHHVVQYSHIALMYAIAHEVGHHLSPLLKSYPLLILESVSDELKADLLAFMGLWNRNIVFKEYTNLNSGVSLLCFLSGQLFMLVLGAVTYCGSFLDKNCQLKMNLWKDRYQQWFSLVKKIIDSLLADNQKNSRFSILSYNELLCVEYINSFFCYCENLYPTILEESHHVFKKILQEEPDIYNRVSLDIKIRSLYKASLKKNLN